MAEKKLNTRILHKIDTLEAWNKSTLLIKKGEICIATVAAEAGTGLTEPVVMIKIGEETPKTFAQLPWNLYAKASDVIAQAKSTESLTTFINGVIANAGIATDEALATLSGKVTTAEGKITALEEKVGDKTVATQISEAIAALNLSDTYAAKTHSHVMSDVTGLADAVAEAKKAGTDANAALETYKKSNNTAVQANTDAIAAINNTDTGILKQAKDYADGKDTAIAEAKKAGTDAQADVDALEAKVGTVADGKTLAGLVADNAAAIEAHKTAVDGKVTTLIGSDTDKSVRTIANEELAAQLLSGKADADFKTLQELAAWLEDHPEKVTEINAAITALQTKVGDTAVATQISTAVDALKNGEIKTNTDAIDALETKAHEHANKALLDTYTQTEANLADAVAKKHEHTNAAELAKIETGDKAKWDKVTEKANDADLAAIAKSGNVKDLAQTDGDVLIFDCGNATA